MKEDIDKALDILYNGGLILYPTDTVWGIGCDATNEQAVEKVYQLKKRNDNKALITLIDNPSKLDFYLKEVPSIAWDLIDVTNKPLTIIYDHPRNLASNLIGTDDSIAIRITEEKFSNELCKRFRKAIVSTSANISGEQTPDTFDNISNIIKEGVDYIVKYRQSDKSKAKPSSIIKLGNDYTIKIIRE